MSERNARSGRYEATPVRRRIIAVWFVFDAIVALAPPLYWTADGARTPILGVPGALFYFLAVAVCITASLIAAYVLDGSYRTIAP